MSVCVHRLWDGLCTQWLKLIPTIKELGGSGAEEKCVWEVSARGTRRGSGQADEKTKAQHHCSDQGQTQVYLETRMWGCILGRDLDDLVEKTVMGTGVSISIVTIMLCNNYPKTLWLEPSIHYCP